MFPARIELATFRVLGGRDNHYTTETTMEQMGKVRDLLPCGTKFFGLRVLLFAVFPAIRKNKFPPNKNYRKHFSRKNLLQGKYSLT